MQRFGTGMAIVVLATVGTLYSFAWAGEVRVPIGPLNGISLQVPVESIKELKERDITLQRLDYSCGSAALATVFSQHLGQPYSEADIINFISRTGDMKKIIVRKGFSLLDLKRFADSHGVQAEGYALDYESLVELEQPVLVPLYREKTDLRHFVIFRGAVGDRVFVADPAVGRQTMFRDDFIEQWQPQVGMIFTHPEETATLNTPLSLDPDDGAYLDPESLRGVVMRSVVQFIHQTNEF